jgi:hypothetical protein
MKYIIDHIQIEDEKHFYLGKFEKEDYCPLY